MMKKYLVFFFPLIIINGYSQSYSFDICDTTKQGFVLSKHNDKVTIKPKIKRVKITDSTYNVVGLIGEPLLETPCFMVNQEVVDFETFVSFRNCIEGYIYLEYTSRAFPNKYKKHCFGKDVLQIWIDKKVFKEFMKRRGY